MADDIRSVISEKQLAAVREEVVVEKPSRQAADALASELIVEYCQGDIKWRKWYLKVIYDFGIPKILEWRGIAKEGNYPNKLFSYLVKEARGHSDKGAEPDEHN